jgi:hypothetical protein
MEDKINELQENFEEEEEKEYDVVDEERGYMLSFIKKNRENV